MHFNSKLHAPRGIAPALRGGAMAGACALIVLAGCGRSRLAIGDEPAFDLAGRGAQAGSSGGLPGTGAVGSLVPGGPAGAGGMPAPPVAGVPGAVAGSNVPGGTAGAGVSGGIAGAGTTGGIAGRGNPGSGGSGGTFVPTAGRDAPPDRPGGGSDVLNPRRCATDHPFVLSIDPGGETGHVQGWLESAPTVLFDPNNLPRFGAFAGPEDGSGDLALWWSIASSDEDGRGTLWFYAANGSTEVAHVAVSRPAAIGDARALMYTAWSVGPVALGEMAVFHHIPSDRYLAVHAIDLYGTETGDRRAECTAIDARWVFAPRDTADFARR